MELHHRSPPTTTQVVTLIYLRILRPLRSIPFSGTSLLLQAFPPLRAAFLLRLSQGFCLNRSVSIDAEGSHVPHNCRMTSSRHLNAGGRQARNRFLPSITLLSIFLLIGRGFRKLA